MSFGHKAVISSLSKLNIESKNYFIKLIQFSMLLKVIGVILSLSELSIESKKFFYKNCSVSYEIWDYHIQSESLAVILSHSSHFFTFKTKHPIKNLNTQSFHTNIWQLRYLENISCSLCLVNNHGTYICDIGLPNFSKFCLSIIT